MQELLSYSATRQAALIRSRSISSRELVQAHLERIASVNPAINAAVQLFADQALADACRADEELARNGPRGPFHGVPFSVKDSLEIEGAVCTAGTLGRRSAAASVKDATVVARLRRAGAIPIARTNLPDLLFAFESDNLLFGRTNNPYDLARTSGGSSGGEAALIAACGSPMGLGSDAAGSVRLPAAFCGIVGIKPTSGRLPRTGHFPPAGGWIEAIWQIGPMARRVEDVRAMMSLLAGSDGYDWSVKDVPYGPTPEIRNLRVAFYANNGIAETSPEVAAVVLAAAQVLQSEAACVEEARPACLEQAYDLEMKILGADGGDGVRAYLKQIGSDCLHPLLTGWLDKLEAYRTDLTGLAGYWAEWDSYRAEMVAFLRDYDVILCPAYTHPALPHGASVVEENFRGFSHTMAYNMAGWPGAVIRCGDSAEKLPIAVQIVSAPFQEDIALAVAQRLEELMGGWKAPPLLVGGE